MKSFKSIYYALQKRRKKIRFRSVLLIGLLFGVNAYAWFVYMSNASIKLSSSVSSWNVSFFDGSEEKKDLEINTGNIYPGMDKYLKEFIIKNKSDTKASFSYEIDNLVILGEKIEVDDYEEYLKNSLPFSVVITPSKTEMNKNDTIILDVSINWPYEAENKYYKVLQFMNYNESFNYYVNNNDLYSNITINENNYSSKINDGLYIESDDADTYFGTECNDYKEKTGEDSCFTFHVKLNVVQK